MPHDACAGVYQKVIHTLRVDLFFIHSTLKFLHLSSESTHEKEVLAPRGSAARGGFKSAQQHHLPRPLTIRLRWAPKPVALLRLDWITNESGVRVMKNETWLSSQVLLLIGHRLRAAFCFGHRADGETPIPVFLFF